MLLYCLNCGWEGDEIELVTKTDDSDDWDDSHCPYCGGDNLEEDKEVKRVERMKQQFRFSEIWESATEIPGKQLLEYYLKGNSSERREAMSELLRRLAIFEQDGFCKCGHLVRDHARINGHSHPKPAKKTGWCGCVFSQEEAVGNIMPQKMSLNEADLMCSDCGWYGALSEPVSKTENDEDLDFCCCPNCKSDNLEVLCA